MSANSSVRHRVAVTRAITLKGLRWLLVIVLSLLLILALVASVFDLVTSPPHDQPVHDDASHFVQTGDISTHYEQWGQGGPAIVLVHGFVENALVWRDLAMRLQFTHRVYALDVRGFGYTERRGPYTLASDTDQLQAFLTALHLDAAHHDVPMLVGHSSGAAIIGNLALRDPSAASRLVFVDGDGTPYGVGPGWIHHLFVDPFATALIRWGIGHAGMAKSIYDGRCGDGCPPFDAGMWLNPLRVKGAEKALKHVLQKPLIGLTYAQEEQIKVPAAVVYGTGDETMSAADASGAATRLRTTDVFPIEGAKHLPMLSAPDKVAQILETLSLAS